MRVLIPLLTAAMFLTLATGAIGICTGDEELSTYNGTIGDKYRVRMTLALTGDRVEGVYFYATQLKDISLRGKMIDGSRIVMEELDSTGNVTGQFEGEFLEEDPHGAFVGKLKCEVIVGSWSGNKNPASKLPFYLSLVYGNVGPLGHLYAAGGGDSDDVIHANVKRFWEAVKRGDKKTVASCMAYPLRVNFSNRSWRRLRTPKELIEKYDAIFSPRYVAIISRALPRNMYSGHDGIMLGQGLVWFDYHGKAFALNVDADVEE